MKVFFSFIRIYFQLYTEMLLSFPLPHLMLLYTYILYLYMTHTLQCIIIISLYNLYLLKCCNRKGDQIHILSSHAYLKILTLLVCSYGFKLPYDVIFLFHTALLLPPPSFTYCQLYFIGPRIQLFVYCFIKLL